MSYISAINDTKCETTAALAPPELTLMQNTLICLFGFFFHSKDIFTILVDNKVHVLALVKFRLTVRILIFLYSVTYPIAECKDVYQGIV